MSTTWWTPSRTCWSTRKIDHGSSVSFDRRPGLQRGGEPAGAPRAAGEDARRPGADVRDRAGQRRQPRRLAAAAARGLGARSPPGGGRLQSQLWPARRGVRGVRGQPRRGGGDARRRPPESAGGDPQAGGQDGGGVRRRGLDPRPPPGHPAAARGVEDRQPDDGDRHRRPAHRLRLHAAGLPAAGGRGARRVARDLHLHPRAGRPLRRPGHRDPGRPQRARPRREQVQPVEALPAAVRSDDELLRAAAAGDDDGRGGDVDHLDPDRPVPDRRPADLWAGVGGVRRLHPVLTALLLSRRAALRRRPAGRVRGADLSAGARPAALHHPAGDPRRGGCGSMKAVVLGYHTMGCLGFDALLRHGFEVAAVLTHRDDPREEVWWDSLAARAEARGVPVQYPQDPKSQEFHDLIASYTPDFLFSFYYRYMIPPAVLELAPKGALNLHGSLLPRYRGRAPVNWVLVEGESETGVSLHYMVAKPDAGDLVDQEAVAIDFADTAFTLYGKLEEAARQLLDRALPALAAGTATPRPLDLSQGSYRGGRKPADGLIDWSSPARRIYDLVRGVTHPYPGAFTTLDGRRLLVWWSLPVESAQAAAPGTEPGTIITVDREGITVAAGDGAVRLITLQLAGQPELPAISLALAAGLTAGARLGS